MCQTCKLVRRLPWYLWRDRNRSQGVEYVVKDDSQVSESLKVKSKKKKIRYRPWCFSFNLFLSPTVATIWLAYSKHLINAHLSNEWFWWKLMVWVASKKIITCCSYGIDLIRGGGGEITLRSYKLGWKLTVQNQNGEMNRFTLVSENSKSLYITFSSFIQSTTIHWAFVMCQAPC